MADVSTWMFLGALANEDSEGPARDSGGLADWKPGNH